MHSLNNVKVTMFFNSSFSNHLNDWSALKYFIRTKNIIFNNAGTTTNKNVGVIADKAIVGFHLPAIGLFHSTLDSANSNHRTYVEK